MDLKQHYDNLRAKVTSGKTPQTRLATFTAGVAGLIEEHAGRPDDVQSIGRELRNNSTAWENAIFVNG